MYNIYLLYCDQFRLTSFCSNIIWLYNLWNCSKSRRSFLDPTSCQSRTQAVMETLLISLWNSFFVCIFVFNVKVGLIMELCFKGHNNNFSWIKAEYLESVFENTRAGGLVVEQRKESLQLLHGDAGSNKKRHHVPSFSHTLVDHNTGCFTKKILFK